jgi:hypothetical protein
LLVEPGVVVPGVVVTGVVVLDFESLPQAAASRVSDTRPAMVALREMVVTDVSLVIPWGERCEHHRNRR